MISPMRRADRDGLLWRCQPNSAWCELRQDFRSFRVDRILSSQLLDEHFSPEQGRRQAPNTALRSLVFIPSRARGPDALDVQNAIRIRRA
jgi:hypothetical protein